MVNQFDITVKELKKVDDMPSTWQDKDYHNLLNVLEVEGLSSSAGDELLEMTLMALQDSGPEEAAEIVLAYKLEDKVSAGVRQNIIQDLEEYDCPWEEYSDISLHKLLFASGVLLYKAFPNKFSKPYIMRLTLEVSTKNLQARSLLLEKPEPAFVTRMLADGMNENCILERLFEDQLLSHHFPEAHGIIWDAEYDNVDEGEDLSAQMIIYSSANWLKHMEGIESFSSTAYNDYEISDKLKGHQ